MSQSAAYEPDPMWSDAWQHRDRLLRIARRRTTSEHEAEDVVSEVLLRAAERTSLEDDALARWLTAVTLNVCADVARERAMVRKRTVYSMRQLVPEPSPEQVILDRETAATAVRRLSSLPTRQREALLMRSAGFGVDEIADQLAVSYKTAESLLSRARAFMRKSVAVIVALLLGLLRGLRRHTKVAPAMTAAALVLAVGVSSGLLERGRDPIAPATATPVIHIQAITRPAVDSTHAQATQTRAKSATDQRHSTTRRPTTPAPRVLMKRSAFGNRAVGGHTPTITYEHSDETFLQSTRRCLRQGLQISPSLIGCPS